MDSEIEHYHPSTKTSRTASGNVLISESLNLSSIRPEPNQESREALERLSELPKLDIDLSAIPPRRVAAVLVLLHVDTRGELSVTLTTRSKKLRSHPGDTALPGGRVEESDESVIETALRESNEEIGLPLDNLSQYLYLGSLTPFVSRNLLIVYPIVYLLLASASEFLTNLIPNEDEVSEIFHWPLKDFSQIHTTESGIQEHDQGLVYAYRDVAWMNETMYRWHSFAHPLMPSPITGLTADILITLATLAFDPKPGSSPPTQADTQRDWPTLVKWALAGQGGGPGDGHSLIRPPPPG